MTCHLFSLLLSSSFYGQYRNENKCDVWCKDHNTRLIFCIQVKFRTLVKIVTLILLNSEPTQFAATFCAFSAISFAKALLFSNKQMKPQTTSSRVPHGYSLLKAPGANLKKKCNKMQLAKKCVLTLTNSPNFCFVASKWYCGWANDSFSSKFAKLAILHDYLHLVQQICKYLRYWL